jgi:hypothetical protein
MNFVYITYRSSVVLIQISLKLESVGEGIRVPIWAFVQAPALFECSRNPSRPKVGCVDLQVKEEG